jgi:hypothetical protein
VQKTRQNDGRDGWNGSPLWQFSLDFVLGNRQADGLSFPGKPSH